MSDKEPNLKKCMALYKKLNSARCRYMRAFYDAEHAGVIERRTDADGKHPAVLMGEICEYVDKKSTAPMAKAVRREVKGF